MVLGERPGGSAEQPFASSRVPGHVQAEFEGLEDARRFCWDHRAELGSLWIVDRASQDEHGVEIVYGTG